MRADPIYSEKNKTKKVQLGNEKGEPPTYLFFSCLLA